MEVPNHEIGISLGTRNLVFGVADQPGVLRHHRGNSKTPIMAAWMPRAGGGRLLVGESALQAMLRPGVEVVWDVTRRLGASSGQALFSADDSIDAVRVLAMILTRVRESAEAELEQGVSRAAFAVPGFFGEPERAALREAARQAGLEITRCVDRVVAEAAADRLPEPNEWRRALVCRLGATTLEVAVVDACGRQFKKVGWDQQTGLGGEAFDAEIEAILRGQLEARYGPIDLTFPWELRRVAEQAKIQLSCKRSVSQEVSFVSQDGLHDGTFVDIDRDEFEARIRPLVNRVCEVTAEVLHSTRDAHPDELILTGGSSAVPLLRQVMAEHFGDRLHVVDDPTGLAVAGALDRDTELVVRPGYGSEAAQERSELGQHISAARLLVENYGDLMDEGLRRSLAEDVRSADERLHSLDAQAAARLRRDLAHRMAGAKQSGLLMVADRMAGQCPAESAHALSEGVAAFRRAHRTGNAFRAKEVGAWLARAIETLSKAEQPMSAASSDMIGGGGADPWAAGRDPRTPDIGRIPEAPEPVRDFSPVALEPDAGETDLVDCTIFAPPSARPGDVFMVQASVHTPMEADVAEAVAREFDEEAEHRAVKSLLEEVERGARLVLHLTMRGLIIEDPVQELVWRGRPEAVQFEIEVPESHRLGPVIGKLRVCRGQVPLGHLCFKLSVVESRASPRLEAAGEEAVRYRRAFASYASDDRVVVLQRVQILVAAGIEVFQDVRSLRPGQQWERELYRHIDECDLFLLFWSKAASESDWVLKEVRHALARQEDPDAPPEILPIILEGPPIVSPPADLAHLHFDDPLIYILAGTTSATREAS
ncbi:MAG: Hsp70 family protein [Pseudomonadota bacterium]